MENGMSELEQKAREIILKHYEDKKKRKVLREELDAISSRADEIRDELEKMSAGFGFYQTDEQINLHELASVLIESVRDKMLEAGEIQL